MPAELPKSFVVTDFTIRQHWTGKSVFLWKNGETMGNRIKLWPFLISSLLAICCNSTLSYAKKHTIQPGPDKGWDNYISKGYGDEVKNFGYKQDMAVGKRDSKRMLIRFDLTSIPPDAIISSAELQLCLSREYYFDQQRVIYAHKITSFWKDKEATWNQSMEKRNWKSSGGDFDWVIENAKSLIGRNYGWVSWDLTRTIKDWLDGKYVNFGFLLKEQNCDNDEILFLSSDLEWEAYRPRLVISYEVEEICPEPTPPQPTAPSVKVYPNPFKPSEGHTEVTFTNLPSGASVKIFHVEGRIIATLKEEGGEAKWKVKDSEGDEVSSGLYLYRIESDKKRQTGKLVIIR